MAIFLLIRLGDIGYDENVGMVIRAASARQARGYAYAEAKRSGSEDPLVWMNSKSSRCGRIQPTGRPLVILRSFNAG